MNAEEIIKAIKEWKDESEERRSAVVILIEETDKDNVLKSDNAIVGIRGKIVAGLRKLMKESEPFSQMVKHAQLECLIEKITSK